MHAFSNEHRAAAPQESRIKLGRYRNFISESIGSKSRRMFELLETKLGCPSFSCEKCIYSHVTCFHAGD
ncbi:hypothetical protein NC651_004156 [Populus alba x Populus x berolinensis]|nr:hypothetical protein NC651_004156 [Populus alba x Populus x berolinensis]